MPKKREPVFKIIPTTWKERYRKEWLRELINNKRNKKGAERTITAWELNELIENKMKELGTCFERDAVEALIEEVRNGKEY